MPDFAIERGCPGMVCGVDEAGRGPLAGPVVAAAVILDRRRFRGPLRRDLDDSKALSLSIAAASVVAKVTRDRIMHALAGRYPGYGWETNVGYSTPEHGAGIRKLGVTPHHRRSFEPVRLALNGGFDLLSWLATQPAAAADD